MISGLQEIQDFRISTKKAPAIIHIYINKRVDKSVFGRVFITLDERPELIDFRPIHFLIVVVHFEPCISYDLICRFLAEIAKAEPRIAVTSFVDSESDEQVFATYSAKRPEWICREPDQSDVDTKPRIFRVVR